MADDHVEIRFYPPEHSRSLRGVLKKYARSLSSDEFRDAREEALARAAVEDWNRESGDRSRRW